MAAWNEPVPQVRALTGRAMGAMLAPKAIEDVPACTAAAERIARLITRKLTIRRRITPAAEVTIVSISKINSTRRSPARTKQVVMDKKWERAL